MTGLSFLWHAANMRCRRGLHMRSRILGPFLEHGDDCVDNDFNGRLHAFLPPTRQDDPNTWGSITTWPSLVVISSLGTELKFPHSPHKLPTDRNITFVNKSRLFVHAIVLVDRNWSLQVINKISTTNNVMIKQNRQI